MAEDLGVPRDLLSCLGEPVPDQLESAGNCSQLVYARLRDSLRTRNLSQKVNILQTLSVICSDDEKADALIYFGILDVVFENAACLNAKIEMLSLMCIEKLSSRFSFYDNGRFETVVRCLKRVAFVSISGEPLFAFVFDIVTTMTMFLLESDLSVKVPFEDLCDLVWIVYTQAKSEISRALLIAQITSELDKDFSNVELKHFITQMSAEARTMHGDCTLDDNFIDALGSMVCAVMKRFRHTFQSSDLEICFEFRETVNLIFVPFLEKCTQIPPQDSDDDVLNVATATVNSLFYCPDDQFKVSVAEMIFPTACRLLEALEDYATTQRRLVRLLLANSLIFLCSKHLTMGIADSVKYWEEYFAKGLSTVNFTVGCIPKFVKNRAEASWSFVFLHFFRIMYDAKNHLEPSLSKDLCRVLGKQILRISEKGKLMDPVSTKVLWLVLAAQYDKCFFAQECTMAEAMNQLIQNIEMHDISSVATDHPALLTWLLIADVPLTFKIKMLMYWIEELDLTSVIRGAVLNEHLSDNATLFFETISQIPSNCETNVKYFTVMDMLHSSCNDQFKAGFSSALWDNLRAILEKHCSASTRNYSTFNSFLRLAMKFSCPHDNASRNLTIVDALLEFVLQNTNTDPLWLNFVSALFKSIARSSDSSALLKCLEMLTVQNMVYFYEMCLYNDEYLFICAINLIVAIINESMSLRYEFSGTQIPISLRMIAQRLRTNRQLSRDSARFLKTLFECRDVRSIAVITPFQDHDARKFFLIVIMEILQVPSPTDLWGCLNLFIEICQSKRMERHLMTSPWVNLLASRSCDSESGACSEEIKFWRRWSSYSENLSENQKGLLSYLTNKCAL